MKCSFSKILALLALICIFSACNINTTPPPIRQQAIVKGEESDASEVYCSKPWRYDHKEGKASIHLSLSIVNQEKLDLVAVSIRLQYKSKQTESQAIKFLSHPIEIVIMDGYLTDYDLKRQKLYFGKLEALPISIIGFNANAKFHNIHFTFKNFDYQGMISEVCFHFNRL